ncbi:unnamed protein product [Blepharisma stoltei]|uniref:Uncharacterized protein n=1 Tax=Blepharisma stoltei TaxID=1481888 RepID=A0AAU9IV08_9CILI|nr:unnamed protein product [Blepharisma stoltei]
MSSSDGNRLDTQGRETATLYTSPHIDPEGKIIFVLDKFNSFNLHHDSKGSFEFLAQSSNVPSLKILKSINKIGITLRHELEFNNNAKIESLKPDAKARNFLVLSICLMGIFFLFLIIDSYWADDNVLSNIGIPFMVVALVIQATIILLNGKCKWIREMTWFDDDLFAIRVEKTKEIL